MRVSIPNARLNRPAIEVRMPIKLNAGFWLLLVVWLGGGVLDFALFVLLSGVLGVGVVLFCHCVASHALCIIWFRFILVPFVVILLWFWVFLCLFFLFFFFVLCLSDC